MFFLFFMWEQNSRRGKEKKMAKFLNYEDRLEIEGALKEHMTFTEIGKKLGRGRASTRST